MTIEPNPLRWSSDFRKTAAIFSYVVGALGLMGSIWGAAEHLGSQIYYLAEVQTRIVMRLDGLQGQMTDAKTEIGNQAVLRDRSIGTLKTDLAPRIDNLEKEIHAAKEDAAAAKQQITDIKEGVAEIRGLAHQTFDTVRAHDDVLSRTQRDVAATRRVVQPPLENSPR